MKTTLDCGDQFFCCSCIARCDSILADRVLISVQVCVCETENDVLYECEREREREGRLTYLLNSTPLGSTTRRVGFSPSSEALLVMSTLNPNSLVDASGITSSLLRK